MSNVLVYTSPARGHLYPVMDTALALARRGHRVHVRTLAAEVAVVRAAGLDASPVAPAIEARPLDDWAARSPFASVLRALQTFIDRAPLEIDDVRAAIAETKPDLLVVDTSTWGAQAVAEASGIPWATWHPYPLPYPSKDVPPFGPGFPPARGAFGRLRDRVVAPLAMWPMQRYLPALNAVRARASARAFGHITELTLAPPVLLYLSAEPFEYPRSDWPPNVFLVGPGLWSPPSSSRDGLPPSWSTKRIDGATKPVVLVTCSTEFQDDGALVDAALDGFGEDPDVQLVCTTAGVDPARFRARKNVILERFVPHALVLPHACAVVCHGGMGITQRALAAKVPPCVVPWGRDQLEVGRRVVEAGAGALLPRRKLSGSNLRATVETARANAEGARRIAAAFAAAGGSERAASLLEGLVSASDRKPAPVAIVGQGYGGG